MSTPLIGTANILFGQTRGRILALLYGAPDESFFVRQIARLIQTSAGNVQRELRLLEGASLVERSILGSQTFYRANSDHPAFPELRGLLAKTVGVFEVLRSALAALSARIQIAFVYGSVARGEEHATSDIDLMIIGTVTLDEVLDTVRSAEKYLRRPVNSAIYSVEELRKRLHEGNHFLQSLQHTPKVFLIGGEDEFRKAGE
jgi:uncharacterized protein